MLLYKPVTEDCSVQEEFCETFHRYFGVSIDPVNQGIFKFFFQLLNFPPFFRAEMVSSETFVCQTSFQVTCPNGDNYSSTEEMINLNDDDSFNDNSLVENQTDLPVDLDQDYTTKKQSDLPVDLEPDYTIESRKDLPVDLDDADAGNSTADKVCHPNVVAICQTKPEIVTVTEQRQICETGSGKKNLVTTKICITYKDGSWFCKNLVSLAIQIII